MSNLSPHRRFVDPGNTEGIPKVRPRRALSGRHKPLAGTKTMLTPHDGSLEERMHRTPEHDASSSRSAQVVGWLSLASVVGLWSLLWFLMRTPGVGLHSHGGVFTALVILLLGGIHVLAIFSQIFSNGRNRMGFISLMSLYVGTILLFVVDHLLR